MYNKALLLEAVSCSSSPHLSERGLVNAQGLICHMGHKIKVNLIVFVGQA